MTRVLPPLLLALAAHCAFGQSKAWQDTVTLPTWMEGAPDIHPKMDALDPGLAPYYPYTGRTNFTTTREPQTWRRLNLENEYLKCSFLPDLGGHLYTCTDKRNGLPIFRVNESVKKADVAPRGAWVAMGIEFSFPVAHSRDTVSPVDFGVRQEKDHAEVWVGDTDRVTGMRWLSQFILRDGSAALEQHVTLSNPTAVRHPYQWWANANMPLDAGTRLVYPTNVMIVHGPWDLVPWPRSKSGTDLTKPFGIPESLAFFAYVARDPYFGAYNTLSRTATVHVADPALVPGKQLHTLSASDLVWAREHLSDNNSGYVEIQAGRFETQGMHEFLQPGEQVQFTERWMGARDLNGVSRANEHAILSLARVTAPGKQDLVAQLSVTHAIPAAKIALYNGGTKIWEEQSDLSPARTYEHSAPNTDNTAKYRFELRDSAGKLLLVHTEDAYEAAPVSSVKLGPQPPEGPGARRDSPADFLDFAQINEKDSNYRFAESDYRGGLKKFANDFHVRKALGRLLVVQNRYAEAAEALSEAGKKYFLDPELRYYLGVAQAHTGKETEARQSWQVASTDPQFGPPALLELAALEARSGNAKAALGNAANAIARRPSLMAARKLAIALLRHTGAADEARKQLDQALALDPLDSFLRLEATRLGGKDDTLWPHLAADSERVLDAADVYLAAGMWADALDLLSRKYVTVPPNEMEPGAKPPQSNALISYYRGYCQVKLGHDGAADFQLAASQPLEYVFPHRASSLAVLDAALQRNPADASAIFLTGLLYLDQNRQSEAIEKFKAAVAIRKDIPAIHYVLGRTLLLFPDKKAEGVAVLREGAALNPSDRTLKAALDAAMGPPAASKAPAQPTAPTAPAASGAPPPPSVKLPGTPEEIARQALARTASGDQATIGYFTALNFPEKKEPQIVLQAYVEVQLQMLRRAAAKKDCATTMTNLERIGTEDPQLPFTVQSFDAYMKGARFQYFLGAVESLCGLPKDAKRRWTKVSKMTPEPVSADFAFPSVAAQSLSSSGKPMDVSAALDQVTRALEAAAPDAKGLLYYSKGILLLVKGDERAAIEAFGEGVKAPDVDFSQYLNQSALMEARQAAPGK